MTRKRTGVILMILSAVLLAGAVISIAVHTPASGPWAGTITQFRQAFDGHGMLVALLGAGGLISFLAGSVLLVMHRMNG